MLTKSIDKGLIAIGIILMVTSFVVFSTSKRGAQSFRDIVAQIKFLKNEVQTKMAGGVTWYTGEEEERINAYGLGLTSANSAARYLYMNKTQIISLNDSLIEFLPEDELKLTQGQVMVLNPDGKLKMTDQNGKSVVVEEGMVYSGTEAGITASAATWQKSWVASGESYSVTYGNSILNEQFLLTPPSISINRFGDSCIGVIDPIPGDVGDVSYEIMASGSPIALDGMNFTTPTSQSNLQVRSTAGGVASAWREYQLPAHCVTEVPPVPLPLPIPEPAPVLPPAPALPEEDVKFFAVTRQKIFVKSEQEKRPVTAYFLINEEAQFSISGPDIEKKMSVEGEFKKEFKLAPGVYTFQLVQPTRTLKRVIEIKVKKPFQLKDAIFIED